MTVALKLRERLTSQQATLLKDLTLRAGLTGRVTIKTWQRRLVLPLWRRELVEIWFRHAPDREPFRRGPFYALTVTGYAIGSAIWAAARTKDPVSRPNRRRVRHYDGAKCHDEHPRLRPDQRTSISGRCVDHPDPEWDLDLDAG